MIDKEKKMLLIRILVFTGLAVFIPSYNINAQKINKQELLENIKALSHDSLKGRKTGTVENRKAAGYISTKFEKIGLKSFNENYEYPFTFRTGRERKEATGYNLIGYIEGNKKDEYIIFSAHYDHLGVKGGRIYNGADDNASGISALLALAKYFSENKPDHSFIFVAFDAEEVGLEGAKAFVNYPPIDLGKIKLNINMDMVSYNRNHEIFAAGTSHYPHLKPLLEKVASGSDIHLRFGHDNPDDGTQDWTYSSDHGAFHRKGIPFIYFGVEDHEHYHQPSDELKNIDPEFFHQVVEMILEFSIYMDEVF